MKKMMTAIRNLAALLTASALIVACASNDLLESLPQKYTLTVQAAKAGEPATRALSLSGSTLNVTWAAGEKVLVYQSDTQIGELTASSSSTESTTLTGSLDSAPDADKDLVFYFHAKDPSYSGQDGTLSLIASTYDFCAPATVSSGSFTVDRENKTVEVPGGIQFGANQQAIAKFTLKDKVTEAVIRANLLTVEVNITDNYVKSWLALSGVTFPIAYEFAVPDNTYTENGDGVLYLAIPDKTVSFEEMFTALGLTKENGYTFTLTATEGADTYTYTKTGFPFENGKYYDITVNLTKIPFGAVKAADLGKVVGADGKLYDNASAATSAGTTAEAMIAYVGKVDDVCDHGLAISLTDAYGYNATFAEATGNAIIPSWALYHGVNGCTWRLPSEKEWQYMLWGNYLANRDASDISDFMSKLSLAGGAALAQDAYFWTSTEVDTDNAKAIYQDNGSCASINSTPKTEYWHVRACLSF